MTPSPFQVRAAALAKTSDAFVINRVEVPEADGDGRPYGTRAVCETRRFLDARRGLVQF